MKREHAQIAILCFAFLVIGFIAGYDLGRAAGTNSTKQKDFAEFAFIMEMPPGGVAFQESTHTLWKKNEGSVLWFLRVPDPQVSQLVRMWGPQPTVTTISSTTSTTAIEEKKK